MFPSILSFYFVTATRHHNGTRSNTRKDEHNEDAILFEDDYFYTQGKKHGKGKSGGKRGGRSTKSKFSAKNINTFHEMNDREKNKSRAKKTMIEERKYVRETVQMIEMEVFEDEKQLLTRKDICLGEKYENTEEERIFENEKQIFLEETEKKVRDNQRRFIQKQVIPLEIDLVNLTLAKEQIEKEIHFVNIQLDEWNLVK